MKAYLQTSESGFEVDLPVSTPDPDDGTKVILLDYIQVAMAFGFLAQRVGVDPETLLHEGQIWVRVIPEANDATD